MNELNLHKKDLYRILSISLLILFLSSCVNIRIKDKENWGDIFEKHQLDGGFELYDNNKEIANYYNREACSKAYYPHEIYHTVLTMIALQEAIILDENKPISTKNDDAPLIAEITLRDAFISYDNQYFNQLNLLLDSGIVATYLDTMEFNNRELRNHQNYWQNGPFSVTPDELVGFMKRLYFEQVPGISGRVQTIMKGMMMQEDTDSSKLFYRFTTLNMNDTIYQMVTGFVEDYNPLKNPVSKKVEKIIHPYFFSMIIRPENKALKNKDELISITKEFLRDYKIKVSNKTTP